jgi:hypothetical protein
VTAVTVRVDLQWPRLMFALFVSPLLGTLVMGLVIALVSSRPLNEPDTFRRFVLWMLGPFLWSLLCGVAYLQSVTRIRGQIARSECLLIGCLCAFVLPFVLTMADSLTLPFGLFGGWVFWRLGVRPAEAPTRDFAPVFD